MALRFYMDHNMLQQVTAGLRLRGIDVLTSFEDGHSKTGDPELLDRATAIGRVMVTQDSDFLNEASRRQKNGIGFTGVIYAHPLRITISRLITDLELLAVALRPDEVQDRVFHLPLR